MAIAEQKSQSDGKILGLFKLPFRNSGNTSSSQQQQSQINSQIEGSTAHNNASSSVSSVARSLLPKRRRLRLDPSNKLYFPLQEQFGGDSHDIFGFDEQKDQAVVERILRVVFLDVERPTPALEKLKRQLAEAEAALEARKKPPEDTGPKIIGEGLVIDEWKERRERYLAQQQVEGLDSV
ncbi:PapD-like superfamily protein [Actinidia rufa]|uniref:PapD-like superfamily protein n=1 Tax=Actinidia rufa TaxID=165716 RepID=A0A7J0D8S8_9ERIC|nr:PapD-like superfamily protein [Actinidia rufa]